MTQVVSRRQATLRHPREVIAPLQADHRGLCRFTSVEDESYLRVRDTLQSLVDRVLSSSKRVKSTNRERVLT